MRNPFVPAPQYEGYTGYGTQKKRPQTVAEILSEPLGELSPNLGASANSASRQREIADMLTQGAMQQDNTSLAGGLSSLGQAFLARGAQKKADAAEEKYRAMLQALTEKAAGGDEASIAQLLSPEAMIGRKDQQARYSVEDAFRDKAFDRGVLESDRGFGLQKDQFDWQVGTDERNFNRGVEEFDQTFGLNQAQFEEGKRQFGLNYNLDRRRVDLAERKAEAEMASAQVGGIQPVPGLPPPRQIPTNVPDGVQSTLVRSDDAAIDAANEAAKNADYMAKQAALFIQRSEGYAPQGEGWLNDLGQITSMRTSDLKNITSDLGPKQREAGSGPMSDRDVEMYKQATVNINNRKGVNTDISQIYAANAAAAKEYAQFLQEYQAAYPVPGAMRDARRIWNEYKEAEGNNFMVVDPKTKRVSVNAARPDIYTWLSQSQAPADAGDLSTASDDDLFYILRGN